MLLRLPLVLSYYPPSERGRGVTVSLAAGLPGFTDDSAQLGKHTAASPLSKRQEGQLGSLPWAAGSHTRGY